MSTDTEVTVIRETHQGKYQVEAKAGGAVFLIDEPVAAGGLGSGPNPYNLLSAALGACTTMTIRLYAERKGWPLTTCTRRYATAAPGCRPGIRSSSISRWTARWMTPKRARLMEIADHCPVHLTLARGSDVRAALLPGSAPPERLQAGGGHIACMVEACAD